MKNKNQAFRMLLILMFFFSLTPNLLAQNKISGIVMDGENKEALIGANVKIKGSGTGTITDIDGRYTISALPTDILVFSYVGLESQEIIVENKSVINITLKASSVILDEFVAIGFGVVKKSDLTGSVSVISSKELTRNPASNAAQALQGKATGVLVSQSGKPGGGATIRVRGVGSISKGADPIFILDGVQVSDINSIQPQDIESMQVLKDASATAIYGANGSNGVIIITTKRGQSGKPVVNFNAYSSYNLAPKKYDVMNASEYATFYSKIRGDKAEYEQAFRERYYGENWEQGTDWQNEIFKNGLSQNYNISVSGGGENSNFNVSLGYVGDNGTVIKSNAERYSIRANSDFKLTKKIKIGENFSANYSISESPITVQSSIWNLNPSPLMRIHNSFYKGGFESPQTTFWDGPDGNLYTGLTPIGYTGQTYSNTLGNDKPNPLAAPLLGSNMDYALNLNANFYVQIDFTDWLSYKITPSAQIGYGRSKYWLPKFEGNRSPGAAVLRENYFERVRLHLENQITFKKTFDDVHNVQATAVYQIQSNQNNNITGTKTGFNFEQLNTLSNGGTNSMSLFGNVFDYRMLSYLGRVMYDYKSTYYLTASLRSDGVSVFAPQFRRGNFASMSLAWRVNQVFFKNIKELDSFKLRLGWGSTGNSDIGAGFQYLDRISTNSEFSPVFGDEQKIADAQYVFYGFASKEIHWESSDMYNFGLDLNIYNSKLLISADYYLKYNNDLLVQIPISAAFGRQDGNPWFNTGKIKNKGIELSVEWRDVIGKLKYGISSSLTTIKNTVDYLPVSDITSGNNRTIVGRSIGSLYGFVAEGIIQLDESNYLKDNNGNWQKDASNRYIGYKHATYLGSTPQPGDIKYADLNADGNITELDRTIIGKTIPSLTYTLGVDLSYKNFDLNIFLNGVGGFNIYNAQRASLSSMNRNDMDHNKLSDFGKNHWTIENASTTHVRVDPSNANNNDQISSFWIEDGSFLRIKDIQLGYSFPKTVCQKLGLASLRMYANAANVYNFTNYKGRDPEGLMSSNPLNSGTDNGDYTVPSSYTFGLQIGF